jgi:hypothetical protein
VGASIPARHGLRKTVRISAEFMLSGGQAMTFPDLVGRCRPARVVLLLGSLLCAASAAADGGVPDDLGLQLASPVNRHFTLSNDLYFRSDQGDLPGADDQDEAGYLFSMAWPYELDSGKLLTVRAYVPIMFGTPTYVTPDRDYAEFLIRQEIDSLPTNYSFIDGHGHLDDIGWDVSWGQVSDTGFISMYGIAGVLPTNQDGSIERDQYLLGPQVAFGQYTDWGVYGAWLTHLTDIYTVSGGKPKNYNTNETRIRVFFAHELGNNWQLVSNPTIVYDWEGASGNNWLLPLGGGVARTTQWWNRPVRWSAEVEYYVVSPDGLGPQWLLNFNITPVLGYHR